MSEEAIKLKWSVQALAQPYAVQVTLYPSFVEVPDELALEFDEARRNFDASNEGAKLSLAQRRCIDDLDTQLEKMSGKNNEINWTMSALESSEEWEDVRELAAAVLLVFSWGMERPPFERGAQFIREQ